MPLLLLQTVIYSFTLWMGLYLLARNGSKPAMRYAGLGLTTYALGLALVALLGDALFFKPTAAVAPLICWALSLHALLTRQPPEYNLRRWLWLALAATIFFALGLVMLILPVDVLLSELALLAMGFDLLILGYAIAQLDAADEGEALLPDALRSLAAAEIASLIFGGQVVMAMIIEQQITPSLHLLLLSIVTTVIALITFAEPIRRLLDRLVFRGNPALVQQRAALQAASDALPRANIALDILGVDEDGFARLTRRAISHMNSTHRLVSSPLMRLPLIDERLQRRSADNHTLERAAELKALLGESIERLKPRTDDAYSTSDEWRHYNVLYYPYVLGLKPLSRRLALSELDEEQRIVAEWFRSQVPERTLHNWQNAAAELVARDLRERMQPKSQPQMHKDAVRIP